MSDVLFLPGIIAPAEIRYQPLLALLPGTNAVLKDLEIYATERPPSDFAIKTEVAGIGAAADVAGFDRFHLYAHSGGGACALAYVAAHPERVLSLAIDEPASDFTPEDQADPYWNEIDAAAALPEAESMAAFLHLQVAPGVALPPPPPGPPPPWMSKRPEGIRMFAKALRKHHVEPASYAAFERPVLYTYGSLTHPHWFRMRDRLQTAFPDLTAVEFEGIHHLRTSHQAAPERTAALLLDLWEPK